MPDTQLHCMYRLFKENSVKKQYRNQLLNIVLHSSIINQPCVVIVYFKLQLHLRPTTNHHQYPKIPWGMTPKKKKNTTEHH